MPAADPQPIRDRLAVNLRRAMGEAGLMPSDVAARAEVHLTQLNQVLRAEATVRLDTLVKLAGALEVAPEALLAGIRWTGTAYAVDESPD
jgi:transcriptional regulator with XRE-family HTH domain